MAVHIANALGESIDSPSPDEMRAFLDALDPKDEEHGAAWRGVVEHGRGVLAGVERRPSTRLRRSGLRHVTARARGHRELALDLWFALARGDVEYVESQPWASGNGHVLTSERRAELERWQRDRDRELYDSLGIERRGTHCRHQGCSRGIVELSVFAVSTSSSR